MNKIFVKESDIPLTKFRKQFIKKLIIQEGVITYSDKECEIVQCDKKKAYRSITELHIIVSTRFKFTSLKAVVKIIKEIIEEEKCIALVWCTVINKVVVKYQPNVPSEYITDYSRSRYLDSKGEDGYSLKDFENIIKAL